jgi:tetratricopeptide (TPR) repeat protein
VSRDEKRQSQATTIGVAEPADRLTAKGLPAGYTGPSIPAPKPARHEGLNGRGNSADSPGIAEGDPVADLLQKGQMALAEGSPPTALEFFHQAAAIRPDNPQIPISAAAAALRTNHPAVAVELLIPVAKQFPKLAAVHRMLGAAHYRLGDYKSSQVSLQQALSLDKSSALSYLLMGCTLAKLGQAEAAEAHFREARALDPRYKLVR